MGCCQSTGGFAMPNESVRPYASPTEREMKQGASSDSGTPDTSVAAVNEEEAAALCRFRDKLMTRLTELGKESAPMQPINPVKGDDRQILVPSLFKCAEALEELQKTSLPTESNLLVTYPKSGTHWLWEIMKMLRKGKASADGIPKEMGHIEFFSPSTLREINDKDLSVFATHLPMWAIPATYYKDHEIVYAIRNPKDVCVSLYYHFVSMSDANPVGFPPTTFNDFFEMFMKPSDANMMGNWFDHVADFWDNHRSDPNIICVMFEDMKKDPMIEIRKIDKHIGSKASDELMQQIVEATSFSVLRESKESSEKHLEIIFKGTMYRKGVVGDWKNHMSEEQNKRLDEKMVQWQSERSEPVPIIYEL